MKKRLLSLLSAFCLVFTLAGCTGDNTEGTQATTTTKTADTQSTQQDTTTTTGEDNTTVPSTETKTVRFGTHWKAGDDPFYTDPITGDSVMSPEDQRAFQKAWNAVKDQLNVEIEFVEFSNDTREDILRSVLAGDPICDAALLWGGCQGIIFEQNVLQPIDNFTDIFTNDSEASWMLIDKMFGNYYMINYIQEHIKTWPLVFNINYIEAVDALKENGQTVYPTDLYKQGNWTWSVFEDYLTKIDAYYNGKSAPVRPEVTIKAFQTDYRYTAVQAIHSIGSAVYGSNGLMIDTPETISAVEFIDQLMTKNLMMSVRYSDDSVTPGWTWNSSDFGAGETVFTTMTPWMQGSSGSGLAERGESMGLVPFPRPDSLSFDDPNYQQESKIGNTYGILKGVDEETARLALNALKIYYGTFYKEKGNVSSVLDYLDSTAESIAVQNGYDIFHEKIGSDILEIFASYSPLEANESYNILGIDDFYTENFIGQSIYGFDGSPKYAANVAQKKVLVENRLKSASDAISSGEVVNTVKPVINFTGTIVVAKDTAEADINYGDFINITDSIEGDIALSTATITNNADLSAVGVHDGSVNVKVTNTAGNETEGNGNLIVYNPDNTEAPIIVVKGEYNSVALETDTSTINWKDSFIESVTDTDGLDLSGRLTADVSEMDVTEKGTYTVVINVTDYAGNEASTEIEVTVE